MALLDDLFDDFTKEPDGGSAKAPEDAKNLQDAPEKDIEKPEEDDGKETAKKTSSLFPTGKDWEDFKAENGRA